MLSSHLGVTSGSQLKKEMNQCSVALDLPNGSPLRVQLLEKKDGLATMVDTSSDKKNSNRFSLVFENQPRYGCMIFF